MWYQLAQGLGSKIAAIDYTVSSEVANFLASLKSIDFEDLVSF